MHQTPVCRARRCLFFEGGAALPLLYLFHLAAAWRRVVEKAEHMSQSIDQILDAAEQHQASDVFLQEDEVPRLKINEQIMLLGEEPLSLGDITGLWQACGANPQGDMDRDSGLISHSHTRYRVNLHRTMGRLAAVLRRIKTQIPALDSLGCPTGC